MSDQLIGHLLNDFIDLVQCFYKHKKREEVIEFINKGLCGMAVMAVGNILIEKYHYTNVKFKSNCLHMHLEHNGLFYDTLFPEGYPVNTSPEKLWLLKEIGYNDNTINGPIEREGNQGYQQLGFIKWMLVIKSWYLRYNLDPPNYLTIALNRLKCPSKTQKRFKHKRALRYFKRSLKLDTGRYKGDVLTNTVMPFTHYNHGEFEKDTSRVLLSRITPLSVKTIRFLQKNYRESGIEITRL